MSNRRVISAAVLVALSVTGCTATTDKSGGDETEPTTLVLASNDPGDEASALSSAAVARFIELVDARSYGQLQVEVSPDWGGRGEQAVLEDVAAGKAELGWSGTRAFDLIDVNTFQPLHAPFLVGSYAAQRAVVGDEAATDMLAGLDGTGLTGLAMLGDELRFPAGAEGPLLDPSDFDDLPFGVMRSKAQSAAITALGARVQEMTLPQSPSTDGLGGQETMWRTYVSNGQRRTFPFVTANAVLWPRTSVVVANSEALDALDRNDREVLTEAATEAAQWSLEHADDQVAYEINQACAEGARIATASPAQTAALTKAARPAYAALRADPERAALLAQVERLVRGAGDPEPMDVPDGCAYRPGDEDRVGVPVLPSPIDAPGRTGALPAGTYRYTVSGDEIRAGVGDTADQKLVAANAGVWTWTLRDGRWSYVLKPTSQTADESSGGFTCEGYYDVHGGQVDFTTVTEPVSGECAPPTWKADWRKGENGLAMDVTTDGEDLNFLFGSETWERID